MSLPPGFGKRPETEDENPSRCRLGNICGDGYPQKSCNWHTWTNYHDDAWFFIRVMSIMGLVTVLIMGGLIWTDYTTDIRNEPIMQNIKGYNCNQLAEYVADKSKLYSYAEHRYEWLCVNQQIKEFQG